VTLFNVVIGKLADASSYALPAGSTVPVAVAFSPNDAYLATANSNSSDVTLFKVVAETPQNPALTL